MNVRCGVTTRLPDVGTPAATITTASGFRPAWMSSDGVELWNYQRAELRRSLDDGATFDEVHTFGQVIRAVRQTASGELLVAVDSGSGSAENGEVWRSSGYDRDSPGSASWTKVLDCSSPGTYANGWTMWVSGQDVFVGEYGAKTDGANGRYVWYSPVGGEAGSWRTIYDHAGEGKHVHGVAFDRWRDRVWVTLGDSPHSAVIYSDNWREPGATWTQVSSLQPVGVFPFEGAVLFGPDDAGNNGWQRWLPGSDDVHVAFRASDDATLTRVGGQMFRRSADHPALLPLGLVPGASGSGELFGTWDGVVVVRLWRDTLSYTGGGLQFALGPSAGGKYVCALSDDRQADQSVVTVVAPSWSAAVR